MKQMELFLMLTAHSGMRRQRIAEAYTVILERKTEGKVITADMLASVMGL